MELNMESIKEKLTGRPTSEEECSRIVGYKYVNYNEITEVDRQEQKRIASTEYGISDGFGSLCNCQVIGRRKCFDENICSNMKNTDSDILRFACPPNCSDACCNNPWSKDSFSIDNGKLYLDWDEKKQFGLRAFTTIGKGQYIGEYRGKIIKSSSVFNDINIPKYAFSIPFTGHCVDAYDQGSAMRLINCGCYPNVEAIVYIHDWNFKVVFVSTKKILPHEELLIEYDFTFPKTEPLPDCYCGHKKCNKQMGRYRDFFYESSGLAMPKEISFNVTGEDLKVFLQSQCTIEVCNPSYKETHNHEIFNTVAAIIQEGEDLVVVKARVTGVIKSQQGFFYYSIWRPGNPPREYILPMWAAFKYIENAQWSLENVYTPKDKDALADFFDKVISKRDLKKISQETMVDYVNKLLGDGLPRPEFVNEISIEGDAAVFSTTQTFEKLPAAPTTSTKSTKSLLSTSKPAIKKGPIKKSPPVLNATNSVQNILSTTVQLTPVVIFRRIFENVVENLTILYMSFVLYDDAYSKISQVLRPLYFAKTPRERKFLQYEHYRAAIEVEVDGSNGWLWCSLCKTEYGFATTVHMNDHYWLKHAICARGYGCSKKKCNFTTCYPSEFRNHIVQCTPEVSNFISQDMDPEVIDSFADYIQLKQGKYFLFPLPPGLPSFYGFATQKDCQQKNPNDATMNDNEEDDEKNIRNEERDKGAKRQRLLENKGYKMNLLSQRPMDESIVVTKAKWNVSNAHCILKDDFELKTTSKPRFTVKPRLTRRDVLSQEITCSSSEPAPGCSSNELI